MRELHFVEPINTLRTLMVHDQALAAQYHVYRRAARPRAFFDDFFHALQGNRSTLEDRLVLIPAGHLREPMKTAHEIG